jgi:hypothetical protein
VGKRVGGVLGGLLPDHRKQGCDFRAVVVLRAGAGWNLVIWNADDRVRLLALVGVSVGALGALQATSLSLSCTSSEWIPFSDQAEWSLLTTLLAEQRSFIRALQYGLAPPAGQACVPYAFLTDTAKRSQPLFIDQGSRTDGSGHDPAAWTWNWLNEEMPSLPPRSAQ